MTLMLCSVSDKRPLISKELAVRVALWIDDMAGTSAGLAFMLFSRDNGGTTSDGLVAAGAGRMCFGVMTEGGAGLCAGTS